MNSAMNIAMKNTMKNKMNNFRRLATFLFLIVLSTAFLSTLSTSLLQGQESKADPFVTPENLEDNVAFWKKIYTEVSLTEGLFHDREYPLIIYKKTTIGKLRGRKRRSFLKRHINGIKQTLWNISRKKPHQWNGEEKRVAELFKKHGGLKKLKSAKSRIRFQQGQKERYKAGLERSGAYMDYIRKVFKQYGIPERITFLPHVESSFDIRAYSHVGAAGMWQFMRRTARMFLKVGYRVDERWDPYKATVAAAKLLKRNYKHLKSWPLAITAYNHGLPSIMRAVRLTKSRDLGVIIKKYRNRRFRFASKNFYGCFLAASEIAAAPDKYFPDLTYHLPKKYNEMVLDYYMRPRVLARHLGISQDELAKLNPSLRRVVFKRQLSIPRGFRLRIPASVSPEAAKTKMAGIPKTQKKVRNPDNRYYSVRRGDNLYRISRRFRVSLDQIMEANNIHREDRIYVGQVLLIPGNGGASGGVSKKASKNVPVIALKSIPKNVPKNSSGKASKSSPGDDLKNGKQDKGAVAPSNTNTEGVGEKSGEKKTELSDDSNWLKLPFMAEAEKTPSPKIPKLSPEGTPGNNNGNGKFDATLYNVEVKRVPRRNQAWIRVAVDETLGHYADWLKVPTYRIRQLNRLGRRGIQLNRKLLVPMKRGAEEQFTAQRLEYHMSNEEDFFSRYEVVEVKERTVKGGENLWSICTGEDEIPVWLFLKYNRDLNIDKLSIGMLINIPVVKEKE